MKLFISSLILTFSYITHSAVIKECKTNIKLDGKTLSLEMLVESQESTLKGQIKSYRADMPHEIQTLPVTIEDYSIRENIADLYVTTESGYIDIAVDPDTINYGEELIGGAITLSGYNDEDNHLSTGINLEEVRSARVYRFLEKGVNIGSTALVETFDKNNISLGSFYGGFLIGACD